MKKFVLIFIFTAVYAVLMYKKPFGDNIGINAIFAIAVAFIFIFNQTIVKILMAAIPWWTMVVILVVFLFVAMGAFGTNFPARSIEGYSMVFLIVTLIIFAFAWSGVVGQNIGPYLENNYTAGPQGIDQYLEHSALQR